MSCPRKRASSKLKPGMMARAAGYWIARSSRAMTSLEGRKDRPRRFLDLPGTRSLNPDRSRSYFRRGSGIAASMVAKANGRLAQLVEHCVHIAGVTGSSPVPPTIATSCFDSTFCKGKAPHEQVEISAVTAQSQQEVSSWLQSASEERSGKSKSGGSAVRPISRSFHVRKDAEVWARQMEVQADRRDLPGDPKTLQRMTLGQLVERYRDTVSVRKRGYEVERIVLNAFLRHRICRKPLSEIGASDFASYRDERLKAIKASTLKRELAPLHNMFELAREEWCLPLRENPLRKVRVTSVQGRRERRLKNGELHQLILAARACRNPLVLPIVLLAVETGMRRSEILSLRWEHVDRDALLS